MIEIASDDESQRAPELLADLLPLTWQVKCRQTSAKVPGIFVESLLQWICNNQQLEHQQSVFSELESIFMLISDVSLYFPFKLDGTTSWSMRKLADPFHRPTLVTLLRPVHFALQQFETLFSGVFVQTPKSSAPRLGVYMMFIGLCACIPRPLIMQARDHIAQLILHRSIRKNCDLARPWTWSRTRQRLHRMRTVHR